LALPSKKVSDLCPTVATLAVVDESPWKQGRRVQEGSGAKAPHELGIAELSPPRPHGSYIIK